MAHAGLNTQTNLPETRVSRSSSPQRVGNRQERTRHGNSPEHPPYYSEPEHHSRRSEPERPSSCSKPVQPPPIPNLSKPLVVPNPSIPLMVHMANLTTKGKTMLNSLPIRYPIYFGRFLSTEPYVTEFEQQEAQVVPGPPEPLSLVVDDDLSTESDVVETRPPTRTHINRQAPENSHGRPLVRRPSPTENRPSPGSRQHSRTQNNLHMTLWTELAWQQPHSLKETSSTSEP